jgi:hypothetical protein
MESVILKEPAILLPWIKYIDGITVPDNSNRIYEGQPCTPFVPCLVWSCNPEVPHGGLIGTCRWSTDKKRWMTEEGSWLIQSPYVITHYVECEKIKMPEFLNQSND